MGSLNELAVAINKTAHDKGWYDRGIRNFGEVVALMHSELSEALEAWREGQPILQIKCVSIHDIGEVCTFKPDASRAGAGMSADVWIVRAVVPNP